MKQPLLFLWMAACVLILSSSAQENPWLPERWFEDVSASDGSLHQCYVYKTVPGIVYRAETSEDLVSWETLSEVYSLGQEVVISLREKEPALPSPPGNPPPEAPSAPAANVSLLMTPATGGGTVVAWRSLDHGQAVTFHITGNLHPDWQNVPLFAERYGDYQFFVTHPSGSVTPPAENPLLGTRDAAMIEELETSLPAMNQAVVNSTYQARNAPAPPPPTVSGRRSFIRLQIHLADSDFDGILDVVEFAMMANGNPYGNPFNPDVDGDGVLDGQVVDSDGDTVPDLQDASSLDPTFSSPLIRLPRYALFPVEGNFPQGSAFLEKINDRGMVLFSKGWWAGGSVASLPLNEGQIGVIRDCLAHDLNDDGHVIGAGVLDYQNGGTTLPFGQVCYWQHGQGAPIPVQVGSGEQAVLAGDRGWARLTLAGDGRFLAETRTWEGIRAFPPVRKFQVWDLGGPRGSDEISYDLLKVADDGIEFGMNGELKGLVRHNGIDLPLLSQGAEKVVVIGATPLACFGGYGKVKAYRGGQWVESATYGEALDIVKDGTAISSKQVIGEFPVLLNGKWTNLSRVAPGLEEGWINPTVKYLDISPQGWILGQRGEIGASELPPFAMLPLRVRGHYVNSENEAVETAVGVDDFSIGSYAPDSPPSNPGDPPPHNVKDRIWIMVPKGGSKTVEVSAPLSSQSPLTFSASGVKFGTSETAVRVQKQFTLHLSADESTESGSEIAMKLKMNQTESLSTPIGLKVMKARTVKVNVYRVIHTNTGGAPKAPDAGAIPTASELENYLTDLFKPQINVDLQVNLIDTPLEAAWDTNGNGILDAGAQNNHSDDQEAVLAKLPEDDPVCNIRVFIVGSVLPVGGDFGMTNRAGRTCWVWGNPMTSKASKAFMRHTIAHEIGHVFVGYGHPDRKDFTGPAPLPDTLYQYRLLVSGSNSTLDSRLLVKGEWDEAEKWLKKEEDEGRLDP